MAQDTIANCLRLNLAPLNYILGLEGGKAHQQMSMLLLVMPNTQKPQHNTNSGEYQQRRKKM